MMIRLRTMSATEFEAFKAYVIEAYAQEIARDDGVDIETMRQNATLKMNARFAQGVETPNTFIYAIDYVEDAKTTHIGYIEYTVLPGEAHAHLNNRSCVELARSLRYCRGW